MLKKILLFSLIVLASCGKKEIKTNIPSLVLEEKNQEIKEEVKKTESEYTFVSTDKDPFIPLFKIDAKIEITIDRLKLVGFLLNDDEKLAVIETKDIETTYVLKIGEMIGKYKLITINHKRVWFEETRGTTKLRYKLELLKEG